MSEGWEGGSQKQAKKLGVKIDVKMGFYEGMNRLSKNSLNTLKEKRKIPTLEMDQIQAFSAAQSLPLVFHLSHDGSHSPV